jgi:hypothetical protein
MRRFHSATETKIAGALAERRGVMFPLLLAGLVLVWSLGWTVMARHMTHHVEAETATPQVARIFVGCEPAAKPQPGVLLRCVVLRNADRLQPI